MNAEGQSEKVEAWVRYWLSRQHQPGQCPCGEIRPRIRTAVHLSAVRVSLFHSPEPATEGTPSLRFRLRTPSNWLLSISQPVQFNENGCHAHPRIDPFVRIYPLSMPRTRENCSNFRPALLIVFRTELGKFASCESIFNEITTQSFRGLHSVIAEEVRVYLNIEGYRSAAEEGIF